MFYVSKFKGLLVKDVPAMLIANLNSSHENL